MSDQLQMFEESQLTAPMLSLSEALAKILVWQEKERGWTDKEVALSSRQLGSLLKQNQVYLSGKMLKGLSPQMMVQTFGQLCKPLPTLGVIDLNGNCLIQGGFYPKIESEFTLLDILQEQVNSEYFLSEKMVKFLVKKANQTKTGFKPNVVPL